MTIARASRQTALVFVASDGQAVEFTAAAGDTLESIDPKIAFWITQQILAGELQAVGVRPARIDHDIDTKPRTPRATALKDGR